MFRIVLSLVIVVSAFGLNFVWRSFEAPVTGEVAVLQLDDSMVGYALAKRASEHIPQKAIMIGAGTLLVLMWVPVLFRSRDRRQDLREEDEKLTV